MPPANPPDPSWLMLLATSLLFFGYLLLRGRSIQSQSARNMANVMQMHQERVAIGRKTLEQTEKLAVAQNETNRLLEQLIKSLSSRI